MNATYRHWRRAIVRLALCAVGCALSAAAVAKINEVTVFKAGEDGYHTYRIPAIVRAKNGDLLAFAEGRKNGPGDHGDIDIVLKRSTDGGVTWGPMRLVQDDWQMPNSKVWIGNPTPVVDLLDHGSIRGESGWCSRGVTARCSSLRVTTTVNPGPSRATLQRRRGRRIGIGMRPGLCTPFNSRAVARGAACHSVRSS